MILRQDICAAQFMAGFICTRLEEQEIHVLDTSPQWLSVAVVSFKAYIHSQPAGVVVSSYTWKNYNSHNGFMIQMIL